MEYTKIYLVTNCYGKLNNVYIGKEKTKPNLYRNRKQDHIKTYGGCINFEYIDEINSIHKNEWKPLEEFWIMYFKYLGFNVLNKNKGGGGPSFQSNNTKLKIKISNTGVKKPNSGPRGKRDISFSNKISKPIYQYDLEGNLLKEWKNLVEIQNTLNYSINGIRECCIYNQQKAYNFLWRYKSENLSSPKIIDRKVRPMEVGCKSIVQYDLIGNFIKEWSSITEANNYFKKGNKNISSCCTGNSKTAYGYKWGYKV